MDGGPLGVLVLDAQGRVLFASGTGHDAAIQRELCKHAGGEDAKASGVCSLRQADASPLAAWWRLDDAVLYLLHRPSDMSRLRSEAALAEHQFARERQNGLGKILGDSDALRQLKSDIAKVAPLDVPVLIVGESGTGKELAATAIHELSPRSENTMVFVNAAALPGSLVESELFGYEAGAFTGAERTGRKGKFELADKSSLFFDEVGDMPPDIQVKLLRVLQDGMFDRVGSNKGRHSDFRLITATNRDFQEMISAGAFRLDLYYRISGVTIRMPSLRERVEDIPALVSSFLDNFAARYKTRRKQVKPDVYGFLAALDWPGNVRQLRNEVEKAAIFSNGAEIVIDDFRLMSNPNPVGGKESADMPAQFSGSLQDAVASVEKKMIRNAMAKHDGNKTRVAEELGISRAYLYKKLSDSND